VGETTSGEVTRLLAEIGDGRRSADELLPLVYDSLRRLAKQRMAVEGPGHTLQATALVHEAYLRLVGDGSHAVRWDNRGHFYAAAAEAMRRILVERARRYQAAKHGGGRQRVPLDDIPIEFDLDGDELIALDEALAHLAERDRQMYDIVMLHRFAGLTVDQTAEALGMGPRSVDRKWRTARIRLYEHVAGLEGGEKRGE
jgi:RNA polymerase sigma factor (TIGR02999 family)